MSLGTMSGRRVFCLECLRIPLIYYAPQAGDETAADEAPATQLAPQIVVPPSVCLSMLHASSYPDGAVV